MSEEKRTIAFRVEPAVDAMLLEYHRQLIIKIKSADPFSVVTLTNTINKALFNYLQGKRLDDE